MLRVTTGDELSRLANPSQATWCGGGWVPQNVVFAVYLLLKVFLYKMLSKYCYKILFNGKSDVKPFGYGSGNDFPGGSKI
jgi:hypothetical protein